MNTETTKAPNTVSSKPNVVTKVNTVEQAVKRGIEAFIDAHLRNSDFSRDTPAWNHFVAGLPVLEDCIIKEVKG